MYFKQKHDVVSFSLGPNNDLTLYKVPSQLMSLATASQVLWTTLLCYTVWLGFTGLSYLIFITTPIYQYVLLTKKKAGTQSNLHGF